MAKINVRSPYYVYYNLNGLTEAQVSLYIYSGTQGSRPTTPTYVLNARAVNFTVNFEIAELVKDYMTYNADDLETEIVWVDYQIRRTVNGVSGFLPFVELKGFYGYGYFEQGVNPQNDSGLLQSNLTVVKLDDAPVVLPIDTSKVTSVQYYSENQEVYGQNFAPTTTSSTQIQYVSNTVNGTDEFADRVYRDGGTFEGSICLNQFLDSNVTFPVDTIYINSDDGVSVVKVDNITECKYDTYKLSFINKYGALQNLWFFKRSNKQLSTKAEDFKRNTLSANSYDVDKHQKKNLYKMGNEKMDLNTGFYPEEYNEVFKQMQLSEDCWIEIDNIVLPVNVTDSSFSYKTSLNDKLINYTIKIDFAFDTINNIR